MSPLVAEVSTSSIRKKKYLGHIAPGLKSHNCQECSAFNSSSPWTLDIPKVVQAITFTHPSNVALANRSSFDQLPGGPDVRDSQVPVSAHQLHPNTHGHQ